MRPDRRPVGQAETAGDRHAVHPPGNDPKKAVQGVIFTKDGLTFKGSQVDRKFSYAGLSKMIRERVETLAREAADEEIKYMRERRREQERNTTPKPRKAEKPQPPQVKREETPRLQQSRQIQPVSAVLKPSAPQQVEIGGTRLRRSNGGSCRRTGCCG